MSLKQNNFRRIIVQEEIKNPISFRYKRKNNNINNSDKNKNPINNIKKICIFLLKDVIQTEY